MHGIAPFKKDTAPVDYDAFGRNVNGYYEDLHYQVSADYLSNN